MKPKFLIPPTALLLVIFIARVMMGAPVNPAWQHAQADPIREALFRYLIKTNSTGLRPSTIYLAVQDGGNYHDPNRRVLRDFAGDKPPVRPISQRPLQRFYPQNGEHLVGAGPIRWLSRGQVELEGSDLCGPKCGNTAMYGVQYKNAQWIVTGRKGGTICY